MADATRRRPKAKPAVPAGGAATTDAGLVAIGLRPGDRVRFRRADSGHWLEGTVAGREADGSVALHDTRGRRRSIPVGAVQVRAHGPRGGATWETLEERIGRSEQLDLFR
jgi:hypothetical protein